MWRKLIAVFFVFLLNIPSLVNGQGNINQESNSDSIGALTEFTGNPIIKERFSADPAALVHDSKVYLYVGHDNAEVTSNFYDLPEWNIYSSTDMKKWTLEGAVPRTIFDWASGNTAWASQAIEKDGKFYWYTTVFNPAQGERGYSIGVAVSDDPVKGWKDAIGKPLVSNSMTDNPPGMGTEPWDNIDPTVFIDDDGQAYLYWGNTHLYYAKLKDNMVELDGEIHQVQINDMQGSFTEAPFIHKYNDKYYLSYAMNWPEDIGYAISDSPSGPWTFAGKLMDATEGTGTNHSAIIEYEGQWYFIYHTAGLPTGGDYRRSVSIEKLYYNPDGTIKKMKPTASGISGIPHLLQVESDKAFVYHSNQNININSLVNNQTNFQWSIVPGLADNGEGYLSFQAENRPGYYLKRDGTNLILAKNNGTEDFKGLATFKAVSGIGNNKWLSFQAYNDEKLYIVQQANHSLGLSSLDLIEEKGKATFSLKKADVTGVTLDIESKILEVGSTTMLSANVLPNHALIKGVKFYSSNPNVISVSDSPYISPDGEVRTIINAKSKGTSEITAITEDGHIATTIKLEVKQNDKKSTKLKDVKINFNPATREVTIEGFLKKQKDRMVTTKIVDPNDKTEFIAQTSTEKNGKFTFDFISNNVSSGEYKVEIFEKDLGEYFLTSFNKLGELTAHYNFNNNVSDQTDNFGTGTFTGNRINNEGGNITFSEGIDGQAAFFDGSSGIRLPIGLIDTHTYSVSLWLNPEQLTQFTTTFFGARDMSNWLSLVPMGGGNNTLVWSGNSRWYDANTGMLIQPNQWTHVAFTVNNGDILVYLNGEKKFSGSNFPNVFTNSDAVFSLGVNYWDLPFKGLIDELKIYNNSVLSETEIKEFYNKGINQ
ncbi:family 43 glycosylhydrolase [Metabacillus sp. FJAT-53654]|uniref:Family 43 glycosylhydrolase n=1 Tax=Metabacillus rhizosphaerae TaxID=3117747 RepID=A0ABZ2MPP7_9BACI